MEALNALIRTADNWALLSPLGIPPIKFRAFLYADDLVILLCPLLNDMALVRDILELFAQASGLHTNISKCQFAPICCTDEQIAQVQKCFHANLLASRVGILASPFQCINSRNLICNRW
jgi:hypothetical protein